MTRVAGIALVASTGAGCATVPPKIDVASYGKVVPLAASDVRQAKQRLSFLARADRLCARANRKVTALGEPSTLPAIRSYTRKALAIMRPLMRDLRALEPPAKDRESIDAIFDKVDRSLDLVQQGVRELSSGSRAGLKTIERAQDLVRQANTAAERYGFVDCAEAAG